MLSSLLLPSGSRDPDPRLLRGMLAMHSLRISVWAMVVVMMTVIVSSFVVSVAAAKTGRVALGRVHTMALQHHPIHHSLSHRAATCRFYTYDHGNRAKRTQVRRKVKAEVGLWKRVADKGSMILDNLFHSIASSMFRERTTEASDRTDGGGNLEENDKSPPLLRFDPEWGIFVGWVENALSDSEFLLRIGIGTPRQEFLASVDTASPLLWVYSKECCFSGNHTYFRPELSSTYEVRSLNSDGLPVPTMQATEGQTYKIKYGIDDSTSIETTLGFDTVSLMAEDRQQDEEADELGRRTGGGKIDRQTVGLVTYMANAKRGEGRDLRQMEGLLGLSPGNGTAMPGKLLTPIEKMIQADLLEEPMFTVSFVKAMGGAESAAGGRLILGGPDVERMIGEVTWVASTSTVFWGFQFARNDIRYGRYDIWPGDAPRRVVVDTGSSGIYLPTKAADAVNAKIAGSRFDKNTSLWLLPCQTGQQDYEKKLNKFERARYFSIRIGGRVFAIPVVDLVLFPHNPVEVASPHTCASSNSSCQEGHLPQNMCNSAIQGGSEQFAVLGNAFIKNHAISFKYGGKDLSNRQIGFANRKDTGIVLSL